VTYSSARKIREKKHNLNAELKDLTNIVRMATQEKKYATAGGGDLKGLVDRVSPQQRNISKASFVQIRALTNSIYEELLTSNQ